MTQSVSPPRVWIHSFFVLPLVFVLVGSTLFLTIRFLTREPADINVYLKDIATYSGSKRWHAALSLSSLLDKEKLTETQAQTLLAITKDIDRQRMQALQSKEKDDKVWRYLLLAMGRSREEKFFSYFLEVNQRDNSVFDQGAILHALFFADKQRFEGDILKKYDHPDEGIRLLVVGLLGDIWPSDGDEGQGVLRRALKDPEPNVAWEAALSLLKRGDNSGLPIVYTLLDKEFMLQYPEITYPVWLKTCETVLRVLKNVKFLEEEKNKFLMVLENLKKNEDNTKVVGLINALEWQCGKNVE